jgi:hypothetical protein
MKLTTIALAFAFALSSTFALAKTVRHKPSVRTYDLHRGIPLGRSDFFASELRQSRRCNQRVRGRIDVERKERVRVGRRLTPTARAIRAPWYQDLQST